jgi:hypothetical protein
VYSGATTAISGNSEIISSVTIKVNFPRIGSLPSAYPAIVARISTSAVASSVTISEWMKYEAKSS